jgi:hypothetical protein
LVAPPVCVRGADLGLDPHGKQCLRAAFVDMAGLRALTFRILQPELQSMLEPTQVKLQGHRIDAAAESDRRELRIVFLDSTGLGADDGKSILGSTSLAAPVPTIWVYYPNVVRALGFDLESVSSSIREQRLLGVALARVLTHEIVHAVAPEVPHSSSGLMAIRWSTGKLGFRSMRLEERLAETIRSGVTKWLSDDRRPYALQAARARSAEHRGAGGAEGHR